MHSQTLSCLSYCVHQHRTTHHPSLNMSDSESSSVILMHSHSLSCMSYNATQHRITPYSSLNMTLSRAFSVILMRSHSLSCMSYNVCQLRMTHRPSLNMSLSQAFSAFSWILITDMIMHYEIVWCFLIHYHACRIMYISLEWHTPPLNMSHSDAFSSHTCSCILRSYNAFSYMIMLVVLCTSALNDPHPSPWYESFTDIISQSHAFSPHTCSCIIRSYNAFSYLIMLVVLCTSALNDPHPSLNMSHSQTFSVILMHSHHRHVHSL